MPVPILTDLVIIFGLSLLVLFSCHQLRIPATVGFILTGILTGPDVLALVQAVHEVEILAEVGVILLLFAIGVEFSLADLLNIRRSVLVGGPLQVAATCSGRLGGGAGFRPILGGIRFHRFFGLVKQHRHRA